MISSPSYQPVNFDIILADDQKKWPNRFMKCILHENSIRYTYCEKGIYVVLSLDYIVQGKIWKGNPISIPYIQHFLICRFFYNMILWEKKFI